MKTLKRFVTVAALTAMLGSASGAHSGALGMGAFPAKQAMRLPGKAFAKGVAGPSIAQLALPVAVIAVLVLVFSGSETKDSHG